MANKIRFQPPTIYRLLPFTIIMLYCHCLGYYILKGIFKYEAIATGDENMEYFSTISTLSEIISLVVGSIIVEVITNKFFFVVCLIMIWSLGLISHYLSRMSVLMGILFPILFGFVFSTLKIAILSYGAAEYDSRYSSELYVYFLMCYCAVVLSEITSIFFIPPTFNLWKAFLNTDDDLRTASCITILVFSFLSLLIFHISKYVYIAPSSSLGMRFGHVFRPVRKFINVMIFVILMFGLWILHEQILIRLPMYAELMSQQIFTVNFDRYYLRTVYLSCSVIFILTFYFCFYEKFEESLPSHPIYAIIIGCLLMFLSIISTRKLDITTSQSKHAASLPKENHGYLFIGTTGEASAGRMEINLTGVNTVYIPANSYQLFQNVPLSGPQASVSFHWTLLYDGTDIRTLKEKFILDYSACHYQEPLLRWTVTWIEQHGMYWYPHNNTYTNVHHVKGPPDKRFKNLSYVYIDKQHYPENREVGPIARHESQLPIVCVTCTYFTDSFEQHYTMFYILEHATQTGPVSMQYHFLCTYKPISLNVCKTVIPGFYKARDGMAKPSFKGIFHFEMGGYYYYQTSLKDGVSHIVGGTVIDPLEISILWLLLPMLLLSIGESIITVTASYYVYTQVHPQIKTISLGIWLFCTSAGVLVNHNFGGIAKLISVDIHIIAGVIFAATATIFALLYLILNIFNFDTDWKSVGNDEEE